MKKALFAAVLLAFIGATATPSPAPKLPDKPLAAEQAFVTTATQDLQAKYKTPADAEKAGYFRYNNEDKTGAISYANLQWDSAADPQHPQPSQLWYDVKGRLIGVDYSIPYTAANANTPPNLWGINPARWFAVKRAHVHYITKNDNGTLVYGHAVHAADYIAAGGSLENPTAAPLVKMKKVDDADDVAKVFTFPAQWNLEFWVVPNPLGAFAENNPLVKPSNANAKGEM